MISLFQVRGVPQTGGKLQPLKKASKSGPQKSMDSLENLAPEHPEVHTSNFRGFKPAVLDSAS